MEPACLALWALVQAVRVGAEPVCLHAFSSAPCCTDGPTCKLPHYTGTLPVQHDVQSVGSNGS